MLPEVKAIGSKPVSSLLTNRSRLAGSTFSVTGPCALLPPSVPSGRSGVVVVTLTTLVKTRAALPDWKFGRPLSVTVWVSPLAMLPIWQVKELRAGPRTSSTPTPFGLVPALKAQLPLLGVIWVTV